MATPVFDKLEDKVVKEFKPNAGGKDQLVSVKPQSRKTKHRQQAFVYALRKTMGNVTQAVELTGIGRHNHYEWLKKYPDYAVACDEVGDIFLDFAEARAASRIQEGSDSMIQFMLRNKGGKRGYNKSDIAPPIIPPAITDLSKLSDEELRTLVALQRKCGTGQEKSD